MDTIKLDFELIVCNREQQNISIQKWVIYLFILFYLRNTLVSLSPCRREFILDLVIQAYLGIMDMKKFIQVK